MVGGVGRTAYGRGVEECHFVLYVRTGFKAGVRERAGVNEQIVLHTPDTILGL